MTPSPAATRLLEIIRETGGCELRIIPQRHAGSLLLLLKRGDVVIHRVPSYGPLLFATPFPLARAESTVLSLLGKGWPPRGRLGRPQTVRR